MRYIYVLLDPDNNDVKYVGQTDNIVRRFNDHISSSFNETSPSYNTYKSRWIRKIKENGKLPIINVVYECIDICDSNKMEKFFIDKYTNEGLKLTNSHSGDVSYPSDETRDKISKSRKGKSMEDIMGIDKSIKVKKLLSNRLKLKEFNPNKNDDILVREKISNTLKDFFVDKTNHWAYGLKMSDDHNEKLRIAKINNPKNVGNRSKRSEEQKQKTRDKIKGTKIYRYKILQYDLNMNFIKEWNSLREINKFDKTLKRNQISRCCKEDIKKYAGYVWKFGEISTSVFKLDVDYNILEERDSINKFDGFVSSSVFSSIKNNTIYNGFYFLYKKDFICSINNA